MDPMVSARVPLGLRDQVHQELKAAGSSPTELINAAYKFFLATHTLPGQQSASKPGRRALDGEDRRAIESSIAQSSRPVPASFFGGLSDDELLARNLRGAYEALA
ncbi:hypothetical protein [Parvibacter caecicola]|uniref:Uncharacterized protein n=1 Tax=Parvibacter caecicola TaxID=747645 RepID=A0A4V5KJR6_9ACTN|nr:hypothetical protein [Parvibacter caecicola]TJW10298.1 hypothetical protein E5982_07045 [Parvibacter caecicola]